MSDIKIEFDSKKFEEFLDRLGDQVDELMHDVGNEIVKYSKETFTTKEWDGMPWQPWKYNYAREGYSGSKSLMVDSGNLRRSIRIGEYDKDHVTVISDTDYGSYHNEGSTHLPKRQFLGESEEMMKQIEDMIIEKIREQDA